MTDDNERRRRAAQRRNRVVMGRCALGDVEPDLSPVEGAEALSLVTRLTRESWTLSGQPWPSYHRSQTPCRFIPGPPR